METDSKFHDTIILARTPTRIAFVSEGTASTSVVSLGKRSKLQHISCQNAEFETCPVLGSTVTNLASTFPTSTTFSSEGMPIPFVGRRCEDYSRQMESWMKCGRVALETERTDRRIIGSRWMMDDGTDVTSIWMTPGAQGIVPDILLHRAFACSSSCKILPFAFTFFSMSPSLSTPISFPFSPVFV